MADHTILTGSFADSESAERAYSSLRGRGYTTEHIHVMMSEETGNQYHSRADTAVSGPVGGTTGGILGAIAAVGTAVALPGIGLIAGPFVGALAGAGAGGAAGSLIGALIGAGITEEHAKTYENDIREGRIVMGVRPRSEDRDFLKGQYELAGATHVYGPTPTPDARRSSAEDVRRLAECLGTTQSDFLLGIGISEKVIGQRLSRGNFGLEESARLRRVEQLFGLATSVFSTANGSSAAAEEDARRWFRKTQWVLGGVTPLDCARTEAGAKQVETLLQRIDQGVLS